MSAAPPPGPAPRAGRRDAVRVLVVDDHRVFAESLQLGIDLEQDLKCVGIAASLEQARRLLAARPVDVVLLDHRLPDGDGVESVSELLALRPGVQIVVLTASMSDGLLMTAVQAGAAGFVSKSRGLSDVTAAVRSAQAGEAVVSPDVLARLLPRLRRDAAPTHEALTARELDVLRLVAEGLTNAAIADQLFVSVHTVRNHVANLSAKLGAHSKLEALSIAVREGLLD